jgi:purine-binding chemotaxis protein CheW
MTNQDGTSFGIAQSYITIGLGGQLFGIAIGDVEDVFTPGRITAVPLAPPDVGGVLNLRGRIVTVIDLRRRLGLPPGAPSMAVGIDRGGEGYGLLVDSVGEVLAIEADQIEPMPENLDAEWRAASKGVYRLEDRLMVVLDVDLLMNFNRSLRAA